MAAQQADGSTAAGRHHLGGAVAAIAGLGFPLLLGAFSSSMSGIIDTIMMGHYGTDSLAAVSGASAIFDVFANIVLASLLGHQILAARFAGREDPPGIRASLRSSAWFCGAIALLVTGLCEFRGGWLTGLVSGGHASLRPIGAAFLATCGPTLLLMVPFTLLSAIFNAYKRPRYAVAASLAINLLNLLLDWLLIFGPGPLPRLGAAGNGLATTLSWGAGVGFMLVAARRFRLRERLSGAGPARAPDFVTSIPRLAWPSIVSAGLDYASMVVFFAILGTLGVGALSGGRVAFQVMLLIFGVGSAFAAAGRILIGRALGAGELAEPRLLWRSTQYLLLAPGIVLGAVLVLIPVPIAGLFTSFTPVAAAAGRAIPLIGLSAPLMAWTLGGSSMLRALGMTNWDMYTNLATALLVQLPVGWLLADGAHLGVPGAYGGVLSYWVVRAIATEALARRAARNAGLRPAADSRPAESAAAEQGAPAT
jgi:MATE family multidrug resistance protein